MKIFDAAQTREADHTTISRQGITSLALMERAANEVFIWLKNHLSDKETVFHVFCGQGNNGGDGLQVAKMLHDDGYVTFINIINTTAGPSPDFTASLEKIHEAGIAINTGKEISSFGKGKTVVIDALFGIGLSRALNNDCTATINSINNSGAHVISIDVPSGMFMDRRTLHAVKADVVLTFQYPKLPFYFATNYQFVRKVVLLPIGLDKDFLNNTPSPYHFIDSYEAARRYMPVPTYSHKGMQGHSLIIGGSYGKTGAALLAAKAALRSGCGLVTAYVPKSSYNALQSALPEAMVITEGEEYISRISFAMNPTAIAIGMGMGQELATQQALYEFLRLNKIPVVIDADALNIIAQNKDWFSILQENAILTPHPKELERLIGTWHNDFEKLEMMTAFSKKYNIVLVAKDARTMTVYKDNVYINSTGNGALATAGSGDVLAGIISGLLAQGYNAPDAAILGAYLHGLTADIAVTDMGKQAFIASTIIDYIGKAYLQVENQVPEK